MKYYDYIIGLGQNCPTSTALRRCHLQTESSVFDWSAGILPEKCGVGGLAGKIDLICNNFKDFFIKEDFENRGNNAENDTYNLFIVNRRTGLQYKHDFPADPGFDAVFDTVREKYMRRIERFYNIMKTNRKILFVFMARDEGFDDEYLRGAQEKLAAKFPENQIDFLFIMHDASMGACDVVERHLNPNTLRIDCNFCHPTDPQYPESWNGNTALYYPILKSRYFSQATLEYYKGMADARAQEIVDMQSEITSLKERFQDCYVSGHMAYFYYLRALYRLKKHVYSGSHADKYKIKYKNLKRIIKRSKKIKKDILSRSKNIQYAAK